MNADDLRALQAPIKERYKQSPEAAVVTLKAEGRLGEGVTCSVQTGKALVSAGLHPATGGDGLSVCSGDMLLEALAACAGVTLQAVATSLDIPVRGGQGRAPSGDGWRRAVSVLGRHAPRSARRVRRGHAPSRRHVARHTGARRPGSGRRRSRLSGPVSSTHLTLT